MKTLRSILVLIAVATLLVLTSCSRTVIVLIPPDDTLTVAKSSSSTTAAFWGLPGIVFENWRPNIHIKASTNNGALASRVWEGNSNVNPDTWSLFEYSQILYYDSDYLTKNIQPSDIATVDENVIMPLSFEQKMYKRVSPNSTELPKSDVTWDDTTKSVVIKLNTVNSNFLTLSAGARIAVFATQRPTQWGGVNDYTIVDAFPGTNSLQKSTTSTTLRDLTTDRSATRILGYLEYTGGTLEVTATPEQEYNGLIWFKSITVTSTSITLNMPNLETGDKAKVYWDQIDKTGSALEPFMLFWIAIQQ